MADAACIWHLILNELVPNNLPQTIANLFDAHHELLRLYDAPSYDLCKLLSECAQIGNYAALTLILKVGQYNIYPKYGGTLRGYYLTIPLVDNPVKIFEMIHEHLGGVVLTNDEREMIFKFIREIDSKTTEERLTDLYLNKIEYY